MISRKPFGSRIRKAIWFLARAKLLSLALSAKVVLCVNELLTRTWWEYQLTSHNLAWNKWEKFEIESNRSAICIFLRKPNCSFYAWVSLRQFKFEGGGRNGNIFSEKLIASLQSFDHALVPKGVASRPPKIRSSNCRFQLQNLHETSASIIYHTQVPTTGFQAILRILLPGELHGCRRGFSLPVSKPRNKPRKPDVVFLSVRNQCQNLYPPLQLFKTMQIHKNR